jgi:TonB-like protein
MKKVFLLLLLVASLSPGAIKAQEENNLPCLVVVQSELPQYPVLAKAARVSGTVQIKVTVKDGEVTETEAISGHPLLVSPAIKNIKTWKFAKTVNATFTTNFQYLLEEAKSPEAPNSRIELELPTSVKITARPRPVECPCEDCGSN